MLGFIVALLLICAPFILFDTLFGSDGGPASGTADHLYFATESEARAEADKRNEAEKSAEHRRHWFYHFSQQAHENVFCRKRPWVVKSAYSYS